MPTPAANCRRQRIFQNREQPDVQQSVGKKTTNNPGSAKEMFARDNIKYEAIPLPDLRDISDAEMKSHARDFYCFMRKRHTVRDFSTRSVPRQVIEECVRTAGTAPSGANHQPWHFVAVSNPAFKSRIRAAAEEEERKFYSGGAGDEWLKALEPIGTGHDKPHLDIAPWLIVVFAQRFGHFEDGEKFKNYYVPESVGIATGFLIAALHHAGLVALTHTPNPMKFLNGLLGRPVSEKPVMIIAVGHPASDATVPAVAKIKKPLKEILSVL
jgi:nitroreductase